MKLIPARLLPLLSVLLMTCAAPTPPDAPPEPAEVGAFRTLRVIPQDGRTLLVAWETVPAAAEGFLLEWTHADGRNGAVELPSSARSTLVADVDVEGLELVLRSVGTRSVELASASWSGSFVPPPPTNVAIDRLDDATLRVAWRPPSDPSLTGFLVLYSGGSVEGIGVRAVGADVPEVAIGGLQASRAHRFLVMSMRGARMSRPVEVSWLDATEPRPVEDLTATSIDDSSVSIRWGLPAGGPRPTSYRVYWRPVAGGAIDSVDTQLESATVSGLAPGAYTFSVATVVRPKASERVSIAWAGAHRYDTDVVTGEPLRIYEQASTQNSALSIDPAAGGPRSVSTRAGTSGRGQLAIYVERVSANEERLLIGPLHALSEYPVSAALDFSKVDSSVYISSTTYEAYDLDEWYLDGPLDRLIPRTGNLSAFILQTRGIGISQGFIVRTGPAGRYHYARVLATMKAGSLLQGTAPNRFVELEISYQPVENIPFAKRARSHVGFDAIVRR
jgi:hypothetical protein